MGGSCGTYWGGERCAQGSSGVNLWELDHWGDPDVNGGKILDGSSGSGRGGD